MRTKVYEENKCNSKRQQHESELIPGKRNDKQPGNGQHAREHHPAELAKVETANFPLCQKRH